MAQYIDKDALVAEIRKRLLPVIRDKHYDEWEEGQDSERIAILGIIDTLEVKEVDINKLCEFRKNIGFAYSESASEYQKQLSCYRQGIEDTLKAQKGG